MKRIWAWGAVWIGYLVVIVGWFLCAVLGSGPFAVAAVPLVGILSAKLSSHVAIPPLVTPRRVTHCTDERGYEAIVASRELRGSTSDGRRGLRKLGAVVFGGRTPRVWILPGPFAGTSRLARLGALVGTRKQSHVLEFGLLDGERVGRAAGLKDLILPWQLYVFAAKPLELAGRDARWVELPPATR